MKGASLDELIEGLADELEPITPRRVTRGSLMVAVGWVGAAALLLGLLGLRGDLARGVMLPPLPMLAFWLIAAVALAAIWSGLRMGLPGVGRDYNGWRWAGIAAMALPLSALFTGMEDSHAAMASVRHGIDTPCLAQALLAGLGVGASLFLWLRGGAPTSPTRAAWVIGIAAGASGAAIVALHCPIDDLVHIALWHGLAIPLSGAAGRLLLPSFLRW
ncbi:MAG: NrsF family protein [Sphingopyxis sp.]|uniref:NrsF family protein n=1 Tax=Sphingopyxis sp. TaxID=1908224 RepID=UPI002AB84621|nr:NrsF family protein [Sphingopyxis sp.]MDZ3833570.1 NrsF family protein [Sphingopyxis sp.]